MSIDAARTWLQQHRNPDGSWGYLVGREGAPEPTVYAAAAGLGGEDWLAANELGWAALMVPAVVPEGPLRARCLDDIHGWVVTEAETPGRYSGTLKGWSWVPGTFTWVEPTCFALISLRATGQGGARYDEGVKVLHDRQCLDGGWNAGTPEVLGTELAGYLNVTGWAVLALEPGPAVERGLAFLDGVLERPSTITLSLAILARRAHGLGVEPLVDALLGRQREDGSFGDRIERTALALCALQAAEGASPFGGRGG